MRADPATGSGVFRLPDEEDPAPPAAPGVEPTVEYRYDLGAGIQDWQRDEHGRVRFATSGCQLGAYGTGADPTTSQGVSWNGDWNDVPYAPMEAGGIAGWEALTDYLCQRLLDLTAPGNDTLSPTQQALLWAQLHQWRAEGKDHFFKYLEDYLTTGHSLHRWIDPGLPGRGMTEVGLDADNRQYILDFAKLLSDLEHQANLPNAEMIQANRLIEQIALESQGRESRLSGSMRGFFP